MWHDILAALGLLLVLEGILPFLNPRRLREALEYILQMNDRILRMVGLASMLTGLIVLYIVRA